MKRINVCVSGVRCWCVDLDVSVVDQQLKLFVSRHSAFMSQHVPGERKRITAPFHNKMYSSSFNFLCSLGTFS